MRYGRDPDLAAAADDDPYYYRDDEFRNDPAFKQQIVVVKIVFYLGFVLVMVVFVCFLPPWSLS